MALSWDFTSLVVYMNTLGIVLALIAYNFFMQIMRFWSLVTRNELILYFNVRLIVVKVVQSIINAK